MKTVCILLQNYYEIDLRVRRKAEALVAAGYSVDVLALRSAHTNEPRFTLRGVNVHTFDLGKRRGSLGRYAYEYSAFLLWCAFKLTTLMGQRRYSLIDVNNLPDFLVFAGIPARLRGARLVFDMHEITPEFYMSKYGIAPASWAIRGLERIEQACCAYADHVLTINQPIQDLLVSRGVPSGKITIVMNVVDEASFTGSEAPVAASPDRKAFVMMYHGTLTRLYGLDLAIRAFALVHTRMPGAAFHIIGAGPEEQPLRRLAGESGLAGKVHFAGSVLPEQVPDHLRRADVGILPTRQDVFLDLSFSNKLSEYIVMGKPVIASRLKTLNHYFSDDAVAFCEPEDPVALAVEMLRLYQDRAARSRLAARAREELAPLRWELMRERYLSVVDRLTGNTVTAAQPAGALR